MKPFKFVVGLVLAIISGLTYAAPVTANSPSNKAGEIVVITLSEGSTSGLDGAATISVTYDPNKLTYVSGAPGTLFDSTAIGLGSSDILAPGEPSDDPLNTTTDRNLIIASLFTASGVPDQTTGSMLILQFRIAPGLAAGTETFVTFDCFDLYLLVPDTCTPGTPPSQDYDFVGTVSKVTVASAASTPIPLPGTLPLLGLGVAALWCSRRRIA